MAANNIAGQQIDNKVYARNSNGLGNLLRNEKITAKQRAEKNTHIAMRISPLEISAIHNPSNGMT